MKLQFRPRIFRCDTKYAASDKKPNKAIAPTTGINRKRLVRLVRTVLIQDGSK